MQPWTLQTLERIAPKPGRRKHDTDETYQDRLHIHAGYMQALVEGWPLLERAQINTPLRLAHFIAQAGHETGGFTIIREETTWSSDRFCQLWPTHFKAGDLTFKAKYLACRGQPENLAELAYGYKIRGDLGNTEPGDGWHFRGGGVFQGTGRSWYREAGAAIGMDLENQPDLIEDPRVSLMTAIWWWNKHGLNQFADGNYGRAIGNCINRGNAFSKYEPIGADERKRWFDRAWAVIGNGQLPAPELALGASGPDVADMQQRLHDLGYPCGAIDGVFGNECGRALASFKRDWTLATGLPLDPGDRVGMATKAALAQAEPVKRPEREVLSIADLKEAGSTEIDYGQRLKNVGKGFLGVGVLDAAAKGADQMPESVAVIHQQLSWVPGFQSAMVPVLDSLTWVSKNLMFILLIAAGVWMYAYGWTWVKKRLEAARRGLNLSR